MKSFFCNFLLWQLYYTFRRTTHKTFRLATCEFISKYYLQGPHMIFFFNFIESLIKNIVLLKSIFGYFYLHNRESEQMTSMCTLILYWGPNIEITIWFPFFSVSTSFLHWQCFWIELHQEMYVYYYKVKFDFYKLKVNLNSICTVLKYSFTVFIVYISFI